MAEMARLRAAICSCLPIRSLLEVLDGDLLREQRAVAREIGDRSLYVGRSAPAGRASDTPRRPGTSNEALTTKPPSERASRIACCVRADSSSASCTRKVRAASYCCRRSRAGARARTLGLELPGRDCGKSVTCAACVCAPKTGRRAPEWPCSSRARRLGARREPEWTRPIAAATQSDPARATSATAGASRRRLGSIRRDGGGASVSIRSRSSAEALGCEARNSRASSPNRSSTSSSGDTGAHLLLELLQGAAQASRARRGADARARARRPRRPARARPAARSPRARRPTAARERAPSAGDSPSPNTGSALSRTSATA